MDNGYSIDGFRIIDYPYLPHVHDRSKYSKGNGGNLNSPHDRPRYNNKGVYFRGGIGCSFHENCFTCPLAEGEKCKFDVVKDKRFMGVMGDGIGIAGEDG